ncbi:hypothetical protein [Methylibium sp.]|uniref:hypothetical protein n=1 Tax=Methylibium sp. TaxID=2067992 RepID=UPI003D128A90
MHTIRVKLIWLRSKLNLARFLLRESVMARLGDRRQLRILFSRCYDTWDPQIRQGFVHSRHQIFFGDLETEPLQNYDLVVPLSVRATLVLNALPDATTNSLLPLPSNKCIFLCDDKYLLNTTLIELGFGEYIPRLLKDPAPPFILKKRIAENSVDCHIVRSAADKLRLAPMIDSDEYFCQELAQGQSEYATHVLFRDGRIVTEVTVEYVSEHSDFIKGSESFIARNITRCPCTQPLERILAAIGYQGICCANYKMVEGRLQLIEINPRFGGSLGPLFFSFIRHLTHQPQPRGQRLAASVPADQVAGTAPAGR